MSSTRVSAAERSRATESNQRSCSKLFSEREREEKFSAFHAECISTGSGVPTAVSPKKTVQGYKFADLDFRIQSVTVCETLERFLYILPGS